MSTPAAPRGEAVRETRSKRQDPEDAPQPRWHRGTGPSGEVQDMRVTDEDAISDLNAHRVQGSLEQR